MTGSSSASSTAAKTARTAHLLFNLRDDLGEKNNLAAQKPELVAELDALDRRLPHRHESRRARAESGV
jgi:hypothetical protein